MKRKIRLYNLLIIVALFLSACNLPSNNAEDVASTSAAQTVEALLSATPAIIFNTPTYTVGAPVPVITATLTPIPLPVLTNTPLVTATSNCNLAEFVDDITIKDGTVMTPGQAFVKKWRIRNIGTCTWTGFSMIFDSGDAMGGPASKPISTVAPGQEIDLEVNLTAPITVGGYKGYWRIMTNGNVLVPVIKGFQGKSFYVDIKVQTTATTGTVTVTPTVTATSTNFVFTVTNVTFNITGSCPNFNYTFSVTANGPGTVNLHRVFSDGSPDPFPGSMVFTAAGTQTSPVIPMNFSTPGSSAWVDVYIDVPNQKQFGRATFACP